MSQSLPMNALIMRKAASIVRKHIGTSKSDEVYELDCTRENVQKLLRKSGRCKCDVCPKRP